MTARRDLKAGDVLATGLHLVTYRLEDRMVPVALSQTRLPDGRVAVG